MEQRVFRAAEVIETEDQTFQRDGAGLRGVCMERNQAGKALPREIVRVAELGYQRLD